MIERSARLAAVVPVVGVGLPVVGFGALCGLALSGGQIITEGSSGVLLLIGQVVVGLVLVAVAGTAGAPVLRKANVAELAVPGVVHKAESRAGRRSCKDEGMRDLNAPVRARGRLARPARRRSTGAATTPMW